MSRRPPHEVLGIASDASLVEARAAFRRRSMELHPDRREAADRNRAADDAMAELTAAWRAFRGVAPTSAPSDGDAGPPAPTTPPRDPGHPARLRSRTVSVLRRMRGVVVGCWLLALVVAVLAGDGTSLVVAATLVAAVTWTVLGAVIMRS